MVRPERFELPTYCSGGNRSIQLSYGRAVMILHEGIRMPSSIRHGLHGTALTCARLLRGDEGADALAGDDAEDVTRGVHVEDDHGHRVVLAERDSSHVHDLEAALKDLEIRDLFVLDRVLGNDGVGAVDAVDLGGLEQDV